MKFIVVKEPLKVTKTSLYYNFTCRYIGRKKLNYQEETWVEGSNILVNAQYSYWTLSYALSSSGASKLLQGNPIGKMVPVDEYIPIKFNRHPR
jgi:collagen beta-1,O-galactosyltransferase